MSDTALCCLLGAGVVLLLWLALLVLPRLAQPPAAVVVPTPVVVERPQRLDRKTGTPLGLVEQCEYEQGIPDLITREQATPQYKREIMICVASRRY
jgi:hypothetical protein